MNNAAGIVILLLLLGLPLIVVFTSKSGMRFERKVVQDWAAENGYVLLESERRAVNRGPFNWKFNKVEGLGIVRDGSMVYYVKVLTKEQHIRYAWLRLNFPPFRPKSGCSIDALWDKKHNQHSLT